jgi:Flp pilus assembly protein TadB
VVGPVRASRRHVATSNQRSAGSSLDAVPTTELMRQVLEETRELVRLEARLARDELSADLVQLKSAAILAAAAGVLALLALAGLVMSLVLALGGDALVALLVAVGLLLVASVAAGMAYQRVPKPPLARTRERLKSDVAQLERHIQ